MSSPMFAPRLIPLTTMSGRCRRKPSTARRTQSVGEPSVMYADCPPRSFVGRTRSGRNSVMLWLALRDERLRLGSRAAAASHLVHVAREGVEDAGDRHREHDTPEAGHLCAEEDREEDEDRV